MPSWGYRMTKRTRNWLIALLAIYCTPVFIAGGIVAYLVLRPLPPAPRLPNPNAYDDLVKASGLVATNTAGYTKMTVYELRPLVAQNAAALDAARDVLDNPCAVPLKYTQASPGGEFGRLRRLQMAFAAEAKLAGLDQRPAKAAQCGLDLIRLGADAAHGGILNDALFGSSIESEGATELAKLVNQLDARTCREYAAALEAIDASQASWQDVVRQEDVWIRRTFGARSVVVEFIVHRQLKQRNGLRAQRSYQAVQIKLRRLELDLASRAYELDKGHRPASAAELVPEYLKAVPKHPTTGKNLN